MTGRANIQRDTLFDYSSLFQSKKLMSGKETPVVIPAVDIPVVIVSSEKLCEFICLLFYRLPRVHKLIVLLVRR